MVYDPATERYDVIALQRAHQDGVVRSDAQGAAVVMGGGDAAVGFAERFDPLSNVVREVGFMTSARRDHTGLTMPDGSILLTGGVVEIDNDDFPLSSAERYDTIGRRFSVVPSMSVPRWEHTMAMLASGDAVVIGGRTEPCNDSPCAATTSERWTEAGPPDAASRPTLTHVPAQVAALQQVAIEGSGFLGVADASSGNGRSDGSNHPVALWLPVEGAPSLSAITQWDDGAGVWTVPVTAYPGPGLLFVVVNGIRSHGLATTITPAPLGTACGVSKSACSSGFCVDGFCCDEPCDGPCLACSVGAGAVANGTCGPLDAGEPDPLHCAVELAATCGTNGLCDGGGACARHPDGTTCGPSATCESGECTGGIAVACDGDHTLTAEEPVQDCTPYRCSVASATCLTACASSVDCVSGRVCDSASRCVLPKSYPSPEDGCAVRAVHGRSRADWLPLLLLAALLRRRRRR